MQSLLFTPGKAFLSVNSTAVPWTVVFEDEGLAAYCYACDRSQETQEESILDAVLIYNVGALRDQTTQRLASVEWSPNGQQAVLYLDGTAQALFDFAAQRGFARTDFPNYLDEGKGGWNRSTHAWSEAALQQFEASLYA